MPIRKRRLLGLRLRVFLYAFAEPIPEQIKMLPHHERVLDELLHAIHDAVAVAGGFESTTAVGGRGIAIHTLCVRGGRWRLVGEMCVCLRDRRLIRNHKHAHPSAEDAERVDRVEGLRAAVDLGDGKRATLRGADGAAAQWNPVDLVLEDSGLYNYTNRQNRTHD